MSIGNIISEYRKKKGATQEQLALFAGVSIGAVSKWETDNSLPDVTLLPAIAEFFGISIDTLLGFDLIREDDNLMLLRDENNKYVANADYNAGLPLYEEAVRKYPNDYNLSCGYGRLLSDKAFSSVPVDAEIARKAISYLEKSLKLHNVGSYGLSTDSLKQNIAFIYGGIGEYDKAIQYLEEIGNNEILIASFYLKQGKFDEAFSRARNELFNIAFSFASLTDILCKCFEHDGDKIMPLKLKKLNAEFRENFANSDKSNYFDDLSAHDYEWLTEAYNSVGNTEHMWEALAKAVKHAVRFDEAPSYNSSDIEFMQGINGHINNTSSYNSCHSLLHKLCEHFADYIDDTRYIEFINKLENTKSNKHQSGIWE